MTFLISRDAMTRFKSPESSLEGLNADIAATLISAAADIALVIDQGGIIQDLAFGSEELSLEGYGAWLGQPWIDTVTVESRNKVQELLREAAAKSAPRWRQVNHPSSRGADVPIRYSAVKVGEEGRIVAVGRDLRAVSALQQRLVDAQQSMEREYARLRQAETRYRLLFQIASEAVVIVDAASGRIVEANPAATQLLGKTAKRISGRPFIDIFQSEHAESVQVMLAMARASGRSDEIQARLAASGPEVVISASLFRQQNSAHFLVRMTPVDKVRAQGMPNTKSKLVDVIESLPDGLVVTDLEARILTANSAFLDLAQAPNEEAVRGQSLERWLGRPGVDLNVLISNLREHGSVRNFATIVRGEFGTVDEVELSGVAVLTGEQPCFGFTIRNAGLRPVNGARTARQLPRSVQQLTELVGRVSLKELVRETTDVIERLCIEAALELTGDNRASAAEMLGLSRQSLYAKLRRYGMGDLGPENEA